MYRHLPFSEYFINTSLDYNHTGGVTYPIEYKAVKYRAGLFKFVREMNYEVHYDEARGVIQINFEYTRGAADWLVNVFEASGRYYRSFDFEGRPLQLRVHHGWAKMYLAAKREVRGEWLALHERYPEAPTEIIGWSMGSSLAMLCCQDLNFNFGVRPYVYTYGSLKTFKLPLRDRERMKRYLLSTARVCLNFADVNDLISYLPPLPGFFAINRVDVGTDRRRSLGKLIHPFTYHLHYYKEELYKDVDKTFEFDK